MDTILVTGAERGTGLKIAQKLVEMGFKVYGLANDFSKCYYTHRDFVPVACDVSRLDHIVEVWDKIVDRDPMVFGLVHAAAYDPQTPFEATRTEALALSLNLGLLAPVLLTRLALPSLIRLHGHLIHIGWNASGRCPMGPVGAAAQGGLMHFTEALYEEVRDTGVKVCTIFAQPNTTEPDKHGRLAMEPQSEVDNNLIAEAVAQALSFKGNNTVTQMVLRPQSTREKPAIVTAVPELPRARHDVVLPPEGKMPHQEAVLIPTPEPQRPADAPPPEASEDEDDDEDDELDLMMEESRKLLKEQRELAKKKVDKLQKRHEAQATPVAQPAPVEAAPEPAPMTEEERQAAEAAKQAFAALLGFEDAPEAAGRQESSDAEAALKAASQPPDTQPTEPTDAAAASSSEVSPPGAVEQTPARITKKAARKRARKATKKTARKTAGKVARKRTRSGTDASAADSD
jgi:NAD(P)-dependent dehydrogenase (short-subunit alcohol dehydrogenase family)